MTSTDILSYKEYFSEITWIHLSNCIKALETKEFLSASIWSAVFVESILKDILGIVINNSSSTEEINSLISRLRSTLNSMSSKIELTEKEQKALLDIVRRSDEIRLKRNRLVHDTGLANTELESDFGDIYKNILQIIRQYLSTEISQRVYTENRNNNSKSTASEIPEPDFPMFISTITPHTFEQSEFIEDFCRELKKIGIKPVRCILTDFDRRDPMEKARKLIEKCNGFIVLGLERSHAYFYRDKEGSPKEKEAVHRRYSSAWLQLETGMAIGMNKEIFVLCQKDLYGDGIFDRSWNSYTPVELEVPLNIHDPKVVEVLQVLCEFKENFKD